MSLNKSFFDHLPLHYIPFNINPYRFHIKGLPPQIVTFIMFNHGISQLENLPHIPTNILGNPNRICHTENIPKKAPRNADINAPNALTNTGRATKVVAHITI
jgi:hypothetical protein